MDLLNKLFSPLKGKNKNRHYEDLSKESQRVAPNTPSDLLLYARDVAGSHIQKMMEHLNDCKWVRAEYTYPSFDSMCFIYKNKVFSVIIDIYDKDGDSYLPQELVKRQLYACKGNNLIPCKFKVIVDDPYNPDMETVSPKNNGWNLFHTETDEIIIPEHLATTDKIELSQWEMRNFAIRLVLKYLQSQNLKIHSFQDTLEVDPQIWFDNKEGKKSWILVRADKYPSKEVKKPKSLKEITRRCFKNDGYFAGIIFIPVNEDKKDTNLYRMGTLKIDFKGLEKIHSVI